MDSSSVDADLMAFATAALLTTGAVGFFLSVIVIAFSLARPSKRSIGLRAAGAVLFVTACTIAPVVVLGRIGRAKLPAVRNALAGDRSGLKKAGRHYVFTYSTASEAPTMDLSETEDRIHAKLGEYFPDAAPAPIAVDPRSAIGLGLAGSAYEERFASTLRTRTSTVCSSTSRSTCSRGA